MDNDNENRFEYALGVAVVRRWADLSRETQQRLFDEGPPVTTAFEKGSRPSCTKGTPKTTPPIK